MDNFTLAVIFGALVVMLVFGLMFFFDKKVEKTESAPPSAPTKPAGPAKPAGPTKTARKRLA